MIPHFVAKMGYHVKMWVELGNVILWAGNSFIERYFSGEGKSVSLKEENSNCILS